MNEVLQVCIGAFGMLVVIIVASRLIRPVREIVLRLIGESPRRRARRGDQATPEQTAPPRPQNEAPAAGGAPQAPPLPSPQHDDPSLPPWTGRQTTWLGPPAGTPPLARGSRELTAQASVPEPWMERQTIPLGPPAPLTAKSSAHLAIESSGLAATAAGIAGADDREPAAPVLTVTHEGSVHTYEVEEGVLFDPSHFAGLAAPLHVKNRRGTLFASVAPGSNAVSLSGVRLGTVALPLRGGDMLTNGDWTFTTADSPAMGLALESQQPAEPLLALEISTRGDCVAFTSTTAAPAVRTLGNMCFNPNEPRPADAALQLARSAAIKIGLAGEEWDLSIVAIDRQGTVHYAGPLIENAHPATGTARVGKRGLVMVETRGNGEVTLRVM